MNGPVSGGQVRRARPRRPWPSSRRACRACPSDAPGAASAVCSALTARATDPSDGSSPRAASPDRVIASPTARSSSRRQMPSSVVAGHSSIRPRVRSAPSERDSAPPLAFSDAGAGSTAQSGRDAALESSTVWVSESVMRDPPSGHLDFRPFLRSSGTTGCTTQCGEGHLTALCPPDFAILCSSASAFPAISADRLGHQRDGHAGHGLMRRSCTRRRML